ncbi:hypothetical protein [Streptomyces sp. SGAir0957]
MSTLKLLIIVLLAVVVALTVGAVAYTVYSHPSLSDPVTVGIATFSALVAVLALVLVIGRGGSDA